MTDTSTPPVSAARRFGRAVRKALLDNPTINAEQAMARARMTSRYGQAGSGPQNTPPAIEAANERAGMDPTRSFSPGTPVGPFDGFSTDPRRFNFQAGTNITARPRSGRVGFDTMTSIIDSYDIARICIDHRVNDIRSLGWRIEALPGFEKDAEDLIPLAEKLLRYPDRFIDDDGTVYTDGQPFNSWLAMYLRDLFSYDAATLYRRRDKAGRVRCLEPIDGRTIAPMIDEHGRRPQAPATGFVQYIQGVPWDWLTTDDLVYQPYWPTAGSPYGLPAIESILLNANTDLRFQWWFLQVYTEGTVPAGFASAPPDQSQPEQIRSWQAMWDSIMGGGDQSQQHKMKWVPADTEFTFPRDPVFDETAGLFWMRKTCAAFGVTPNDLGITMDVNRANGETQVDVQFRVSTLPVVQHVEGLLCGYLQDDRQLPVKFVFDTGQEIEDRLADAQIWQIGIQTGMASADEGRAQLFSLPVDESRPVPRFIMTSRGGPIPLDALMAVAGPLDAETAAPSEDAPLPDEAFVPVEGVLPQPAPATNAREITPGDVLPDDQSAPDVLKAETAGITAETGLTSYDLGKDKEEDKKDLEDEDPGVDTPLLSDDEHGDHGTLKAAQPTLTAAGILILAADTGRVLLIQRGIND